MRSKEEINNDIRDVNRIIEHDYSRLKRLEIELEELNKVDKYPKSVKEFAFIIERTFYEDKPQFKVFDKQLYEKIK